MKKRTVFYGIFALLTIFSLNSEEAWKRFEEGRARFEAREFDLALVAFKDAVEIRRERYGKARERLENVLGSAEAKKNGDSLHRLIERLAQRDLRAGDLESARKAAGDSLAEELRLIERYRISDVHQNLIDVLEDLLLLKSGEDLEDSLSGLREKVDLCARYPEAEYWIGMIYLAEGEHRIAERQFLAAIEQAPSLIVPGDVHAFRYELSRLYLGRRDYASMERILKDVLAADALYAEPGKARLLDAMKSAVSDRGIDKFLELYRHDAEFARKAYAILGEYYCKSGRYSQAVRHLMMAVDVTATRIVKALLDENPDYRFSSLSALLRETRSDDDLLAYAAEEGFERSLYYLGAALLGEGRIAQAKAIWLPLSKGEGEWASRATESLKRPEKEPVTERPEL
jgi:tetratricopeptide (TPR) repeat protein